MTSLKRYLDDGADYQARAVLTFLQGSFYVEGFDENKSFDRINVARWENCREQGYVVMFNVSGKQLNIAFFEHRNSDNICAVKWVQNTMNTPTIDTAKFGDVYKDKYDVSHSVGHGEIKEMADWINEQLNEFWGS